MTVIGHATAIFSPQTLRITIWSPACHRSLIVTDAPYQSVIPPYFFDLGSCSANRKAR